MEIEKVVVVEQTRSRKKAERQTRAVYAPFFFLLLLFSADTVKPSRFESRNPSEREREHPTGQVAAILLAAHREIGRGMLMGRERERDYIEGGRRLSSDRAPSPANYGN